MKEGFAEIFLSKCDLKLPAFLNMLNVFIARPPGTIEYASFRINFKTMLHSKAIEPAVSEFRGNERTNVVYEISDHYYIAWCSFPDPFCIAPHARMRESFPTL